MKLKLNDDGHAVLRDGKPVYVGDTGEVTFDAAESVASITRLKEEAEAARRGASNAKGEIEALRKSLVFEKVGSRIAKSPVAEKLTVPVDMVQSAFSSSFRLEGDELVAYDKSGNKIYSRSNPGKPAPFDEAIETLIDSSPHRDRIVRAAPVTSQVHRQQPVQGGAKRIGRSAFDRFSAGEKTAFIKSGGTIFD